MGGTTSENIPNSQQIVNNLTTTLKTVGCSYLCFTAWKSGAIPLSHSYTGHTEQDLTQMFAFNIVYSMILYTMF